MKKIIAVILLHCICTPGLYAKQQLWGYIVHSSGLSSHYIKTKLSQYSVVAITGFKIDKTGSLSKPGTPVYTKTVRYAGNNRITVYPLITFTSISSGCTVLNSRQLRKRAIDNIYLLVTAEEFEGIHLDFEYLPAGYKYQLKAFLQSAKKRLPGIKVTMAVFPQVDFPAKWAGFHDIKLLAPCIDEIVIMCYDYHGLHTGKGPVTDIMWAEKNIQSLLKYITPDRVWLGIPAYGYIWEGKKPKVITARKGKRLSEIHRTKRDSSGTVRLDIVRKKGRMTGYYADRHTRQMLRQLATAYKLRGTAMWRLGFEE